MAEKVKFSRTKIWLVFGALFVCGAMVGVSIANWGHAAKRKNIESPVAEQSVKGAIAKVIERAKEHTVNDIVDEESAKLKCEAVEKVLLGRLINDDYNPEYVKQDLETYKKLIDFGCKDNHDKYVRALENKEEVLRVVYPGYEENHSYADGFEESSQQERTCDKIERSLQKRLPGDYADQDPEMRIERAKIFAVMAERGCPENNQKYVDAAKQELEIARAIEDDKFDEDEAIEVVETYKRLRMQQDAEEIFDKVKKMTNPAIDFIMQVEKIINE